jgi:hypothetical protein
MHEWVGSALAGIISGFRFPPKQAKAGFPSLWFSDLKLMLRWKGGLGEGGRRDGTMMSPSANPFSKSSKIYKLSAKVVYTLLRKQSVRSLMPRIAVALLGRNLEMSQKLTDYSDYAICCFNVTWGLISFEKWRIIGYLVRDVSKERTALETLDPIIQWHDVIFQNSCILNHMTLTTSKDPLNIKYMQFSWGYKP